MKRLFALALLIAVSAPAMSLEPLPEGQVDEGAVYRIEVLQVTDIGPYQDSFEGFLKTLADNGITQGRNLVVRRTKIDFDIENGGFWDRLGVLRQIKKEALRMTESKPDLVLTIGTPATKYARDILDDARIPVVFTAVANPRDAGCTSLKDAGPGVTGATLYTDMGEALKVVKEIFPSVKKIGMVHTDDENGIAHVDTTKQAADGAGIEVASRMVGKSDAIVPSLKELVAEGKGAQMFAVPLDTYYGLRKLEPARDLSDFAAEYDIPVVSFALVRVPGAAVYVGADFRTVGSLSGNQAVKILKRRMKPDVLPIVRQERPTVLIDPQRVAALKVTLPESILAKKAETREGFWEIAKQP